MAGSLHHPEKDIEDAGDEEEQHGVSRVAEGAVELAALGKADDLVAGQQYKQEADQCCSQGSGIGPGQRLHCKQTTHPCVKRHILARRAVNISFWCDQRHPRGEIVPKYTRRDNKPLFKFQLVL